MLRVLVVEKLNPGLMTILHREMIEDDERAGEATRRMVENHTRRFGVRSGEGALVWNVETGATFELRL